MAEAMQAKGPPQPQQSKPKKKRYLFQVLAGTHWEAGPTCPECKGHLKDNGDCGKCEYSSRTSDKQPVVRDIKYGPGRDAGDIVASDVDLAKRYNTPGMPPKFRNVGEDGVKDEHAAELTAERQRANQAQTTLRSALEKMTREGLIAWAEEQKIDIGGAVKRDDVLSAVLRSQFPAVA